MQQQLYNLMIVPNTRQLNKMSNVNKLPIDGGINR